ncbi:MAG: VCBS repeat-containing protein [bacterium]|nr:VCBS repeat-containing protein [bacterium]
MNLFGLLVLAFVSFLIGCGPEQRDDATPVQPARPAVPEAKWQEMLDSEALLDALGPSFRSLARSVENLRVPDAQSVGLFDLLVETADLPADSLQTGTPRSETLPREVLEGKAGALTPPRAPSDLDLLRPLLDRVTRFERVGLGTKRGRFVDPERRIFETDLQLKGFAHLHSQTVASVSGRIQLRWKRRNDAELLDANSWRIASWRTKKLKLHRAPRRLFQEVLAHALPEEDTLRRARHSEHERLVARYLKDPEGFQAPTPHFHLASHDRHPGIAVIDIDGDGDDDIYVMVRWGPNQLLVNDGNGHFEERAAEVGLDIEDHSAAAVFADFDNDGDPDVFVGRTLAPSVYLENVEGRFVERADGMSGGPMPNLVASLSAVDYNGDGLLDIYASTYAANIIVKQYKTRRIRASRGAGAAPDLLLEEFLPERDAKRLLELSASAGSHEYLLLPGPPNLLLTNQGGGRFSHDPQNAPLRLFSNTYQATWSDFDRDGDPDVYLAHDFSPNQFFRNELAGKFTDITEETGTADIGFGMGVGWGDYDNDGRQDLYVTNMYSKAGNRITEFFGEADPRFRKMAHGNSLFRNTGERFELVSGKGGLEVEIAGWSWGGQFADFDNDGFLDLYALSGYYTTPPEVESVADI